MKDGSIKSRMGINGIRRIASREFSEHGLERTLEDYGRPLFLMVSGAHNFGFPSVNSDVDIRGVYLAPTERFLGIREKAQEQSLNYMSSDRMLDVNVEEVGKYLMLIAKSNGNRLEWPNSDLLFRSSPEFEELKKVVNVAGLSQKLLNHYLNFARDLFSGKTKASGVKRDLYTLRTYMTGINILENGIIDSNISRLNELFGYEIVDTLIRKKQLNEWGDSSGYSQKELRMVVTELDKRLQQSGKKSSLPENPNTREINNYLCSLRSS
jgi:uncharacterized protein